MSELRPERLVSIPELAKMQGIHRKTAFVRMLKMHAEDVASNRGGWLLRTGRKLLINLSALRREHPGIFAREYVRRDEHEDIVNRVSAIEESMKQDRKRLNAVAASVRDVKTEYRAGRPVSSGDPKDS